MVTSEAFFLKEKFREYYKTHEVKFPNNPESREFGFGEFKRKILGRHLSFQSHKELNNFLVKETPLFISYSNAYYERPAAQPMDAKNLLASDIVYEFDADDIPTDCKQEHDSWECPKCGKTGKGSQEKCDACGAHNKISQWFCEKCLGEAKKQTLDLIDILLNDFGLKKDWLKLNFSGNAGYHIHIEADKISKLKQEARIELLDYLTLKDFDLLLHGFVGKDNKMIFAPQKNERIGLTKRVFDSLRDFLETATNEELARAGNVTTRKTKVLVTNRKDVLARLDEGVLFSPWSVQKSGVEFWANVVDFIVNSLKLNIDRQTSVDLKKIIRVPDTLHGGTGFVAKSIPLDKLKEFEPFNDGVVFGNNPVKVFINKAPKFILKNQEFGPFENQEKELPEFAAVFLIAKGLAQPI